jgi:hypothetical protein
MFWVVVLAGEGRAQAMHHILILDLGGSAIHAQIVHTPVTTVVAQISTSNHNDLVHDYDTIDWNSRAADHLGATGAKILIPLADTPMHETHPRRFCTARSSQPHHQ